MLLIDANYASIINTFQLTYSEDAEQHSAHREEVMVDGYVHNTRQL